MPSSTVEHRTYRTLRRRLLAGELPPGSRLSALAISKEMGISPTPVMQAIRRLEGDGLVGLVPHFGAFVRQPTIREIAELFDLRRALEGFAARRVARKATPQQIALLEQTCDDWESTLAPRRTRPDDPRMIGRSTEADLLFHMYLMDIAGNRRALKVFRDCHLISRVFGSHGVMARRPSFAQEESDLAQHREVIRAIRERKPAAAARAVDAHLREGRRRLVEHLRSLKRSGKQPVRSPAITSAIVRTLSRIENYRPGRI